MAVPALTLRPPDLADERVFRHAHATFAEEGFVCGHIGYCVLPGYRRRGHATEILRKSLTVAHRHGVDKALLTCDETNVASQKVIEHCGGALESTDGRTRRYWIG